MIQMDWWVYALGSAPVGALISALALLGDRQLQRRNSEADRTAASRREYDNKLFEKREEALDFAQTVLYEVVDTLATEPFDSPYDRRNFLRRSLSRITEAQRAIGRYAPSALQPLDEMRSVIPKYTSAVIGTDSTDEAASRKAIDEFEIHDRRLRQLPGEFQELMHEEMRSLPLRWNGPGKTK